MAAPVDQVFSPMSFQELFSVWKQFPDAELFAGGLEFMRDQSGRILKFPQIISLAKLDELRKISRTERYLEIGAMVKLNQIIDLGKIVPDVLAYCLKNIADPQVRNLAAIGGNICIPSRRYDVSAPMIALDAQFELRTAQSTRWISASRFLSLPGPPALAAQEILTRIRVPLEPWSFSWYRKFRASGGNEPGGGILIIMRNQKNILTDIRVVYSGKTILREKNSETMLEGQRLPLDRKNAEAFVNAWRTYLSVFEGNEEYIFPGEAENLNPELIKAQIVNFIESILMNLSD